MEIVKLDPIREISLLFISEDGVDYAYEEMKNILPHITYDERLDQDCKHYMIMIGSHDGTLFFTDKIIGEALEPIVNKKLYFTDEISDEQLKELKDIEYTIGSIELRSERGLVVVPDGKIYGRTYEVIIPVKCKYIF